MHEEIILLVWALKKNTLIADDILKELRATMTYGEIGTFNAAMELASEELKLLIKPILKDELAKLSHIKDNDTPLN